MKFAALLVFVVYLCQTVVAQFPGYPPTGTHINVRRTVSGVPIPGVPNQQRINIRYINAAPGPPPPTRTQINIRQVRPGQFPFGK